MKFAIGDRVRVLSSIAPSTWAIGLKGMVLRVPGAESTLYRVLLERQPEPSNIGEEHLEFDSVIDKIASLA